MIVLPGFSYDEQWSVRETICEYSMGAQCH